MSDTTRSAGLESERDALRAEVERLRAENAKLRGDLVHCDLAIAHLRAEVDRLAGVEEGDLNA